MSTRRSALIVGTSLVACLLGCESGASIGAICTRASECASPLVCRIGRCRTECVEARDCPAGQVCLLNADRLGACELPAIDVCSVSCDPPLRCASGHCRVECMTDRDCPGGHVCTGSACQRADSVIDAGPVDAASEDAGSDASTDAAQAMGHDGGHPVANDGSLVGHGDGGLACDPVSETGCGSQRCAIPISAPGCVDATGTSGVSDPCGAEAECAWGLSCQGARCVQICPIGDDAYCGLDLVCSLDSVHGQRALATANGIGLCTEACDPLFHVGCPTDATCAIGTGGSGNDFTWCRDIGPGREGASCSNALGCATTLDCYMGACREFCDAASGHGCPTNRHCDGTTSFVGRPQVGACIP